MNKPLDCVGVPMDGVGKHDFLTGKIEACLVNPTPEAAELLATTDSARTLAEELSTLLTAERERNAALCAKLEVIRGVLIPVSEDIWHGKWRVNRAIELARD